METLYRYFTSDAPAVCPSCQQPLPTRGEVRTMSLQVRPPHVVYREGRAIESGGWCTETRCFLRVCQCGLALAVQPLEGGFNYAFRCRVCDSFSPNVSGHGWCLCCILERSAGIRDARALIETLNESDTCMGRTRSEFLDGFLKGVLLGVPDLVVPDAA